MSLQTETEEIEIPPGAVVACPLKGFDLRAVTQCVACPHFTGLTDRFPGGPHEFKVRYLVGCAARPTLREIKGLAV
jgi:hypothetical protein